MLDNAKNPKSRALGTLLSKRYTCTAVSKMHNNRIILFFIETGKCSVYYAAVNDIEKVVSKIDEIRCKSFTLFFGHTGTLSL